MKGFLLDTHVFLWWASGSEKMSKGHRAILEDVSTELWLSVVSAWEVTIKASSGKLSLPSPPLEFFTQACSEYGFRLLPIQLSHAVGVSQLPRHHCDPFDRLLISQARCERLTVLSDDAMVRQYKLEDLQVL